MADENTPPTGGQAQPKEPETFSREYVSELRAENKGWRLKASEMEAKAKAAEEASQKALADAQTKITEASTAAERRIILAEMKAAAVKAGMVDLDGLKLADLSTLKLTEKGEVEGADALMEALKKAKPYLFGKATTSTTKEPPAPDKSGTSDFKKLTPEQKAAHMKAKYHL